MNNPLFDSIGGAGGFSGSSSSGVSGSDSFESAFNVNVSSISNVQLGMVAAAVIAAVWLMGR